MINHSDYVAQAENDIYAREEQRTEDQSLIWIQNLQDEFEKDFGHLPEHQAILLKSKRDKIPSLDTNLKILNFDIERIEDSLFELLKKKRELKFSLLDAQEDLAKYEQKLKTQKEKNDAFEAQAEMEYERLGY